MYKIEYLGKIFKFRNIVKLVDFCEKAEFPNLIISKFD